MGLSANSLTPQMKRAIRRTPKSKVETIKRRMAVTRSVRRISIRLLRTRNRLARRLHADAPARRINLPSVKFLEDTFGFGDKERYRGLSLGMYVVGEIPNF